METLSQVAAIVAKDLRSELRTKEILTSMLVFALLVLVIFSFAFDLRLEDPATVAPGVLWVAIIFAGVLGLGRSFALERDRGSLEGLVLCPVDRGVIFAGKLLANLLFILVVEGITLVAFATLFNLPVLIAPVLLTILLGTVGFAAVGTLFAGLAANTRAREVMLPVLLFPVLVPVIIGAVKATGLALTANFDEYSGWLNLLGVFDLVFLAVAFMVFEFVLEE